MPEVERCRACGVASLDPVLDLGRTPLANRLLDPGSAANDEPTYPLVLARCSACSLLQLTWEVPPAELFGEYVYLSSFSDTMTAHAHALAQELIVARHLDARSHVVEVASNDGYLLKSYVARGIPVLGVEPAANIAEVAIAANVPTRVAFFGRALAERLVAEGKRADVVHAHNVLAHVPDLDGFVAGLAHIVKDDGVIVVEFPYAIDMIERVEFDTIYHEHLCCFALSPLLPLFARHGLVVADAKRVPIHGGSLQVRLARTTAVGGVPAQLPAATRVAALLEEERRWGVADPSRYADFAGRVHALCARLRSQVEALHASGKRIAAYGASAKGTTLLAATGIGRFLDYVVDRSTVKQGRLTPGTHLPIRPPEVLLEDQPDVVLLLTWNFEAEILAQQAEYRRRGGKFLVPLPEPHLV